MYIKFCRQYIEDKKDEGENVLPESKLSVELEKERGNQAQGNTGVWRTACLCLIMICLVLLLITIVLTVKLHSGSTVCSDREGTITADSTEPAVENCSFQWCQNQFPQIQHRRRGCQQCTDGWLTFEQSQYFLSTYRLSWDESQMNCTNRGGSLAVISNQRVQNFLSKKANLKYWIGLRNKGSWTWVDNNRLGESYWSNVNSQGDCAILDTERPSDMNWMKGPCRGYMYFICQIEC